MTHQVTIRNTGHRFPAQDGSSILQSAFDAGLVLPYGCRDGACGSCKGKLPNSRTRSYFQPVNPILSAYGLTLKTG